MGSNPTTRSTFYYEGDTVLYQAHFWVVVGQNPPTFTPFLHKEKNVECRSRETRRRKVLVITEVAAAAEEHSHARIHNHNFAT